MKCAPHPAHALALVGPELLRQERVDDDRHAGVVVAGGERLRLRGGAQDESPGRVRVVQRPARFESKAGGGWAEAGVGDLKRIGNGEWGWGRGDGRRRRGIGAASR